MEARTTAKRGAVPLVCRAALQTRRTGLPLPPGTSLPADGVSGSARCRGFDLDLELWKGQPSHAEKS